MQQEKYRIYSIRVSDSMTDQIDQIAERDGKSRNAIINEAIEQYLAKREEKDGHN